MKDDTFTTYWGGVKPGSKGYFMLDPACNYGSPACGL